MLNFNLDDEMAKVAAAENEVVEAANKQDVTVAQLEEDEKINSLFEWKHIYFYSKPMREVKSFFDKVIRFFFHLEPLENAGKCKNCGQAYPYEKVGHACPGWIGNVYRCKNCGCLRSNVHYESGY